MGLTPFRELPLSDKCRFCILVIFADAPSRGGELKISRRILVTSVVS